ncbi:MAG: hypothetical protein ACSHXW_18355, partial [Yoonia sp.]
MANKIENVAMYVVLNDGELKFMSSVAEGSARVAPVYLDGERLEGVYSEVQHGALDNLIGDAAVSEVRAEVGAGIKKRNAALKKWSTAAKKASAAKKAGASSVMLLSLAACGGDGGSAVEVKTGSISTSDDKIDIVGASSGVVITVASDSDGNEYENVKVTVNASGSGELRIKFDDEADTIELSSASDIRGFSTIVVEEGTVDFTEVNLPSSINVIQVGSAAELTYGQYISLASIELRDGAIDDEEVDLTVVVANLEQARIVDTDANNGDAGIIKDEVDVAIELQDGVGGQLSFAQLVELQALVSNDVESYSITDEAQNLFVFEDDVAVGFKDDVEAALDAAEGVTITDAKLSVNAELLTELSELGVTFEGEVFNLERSAESVVEGDSVTFTLDTVNVAEGARYDYSVAGVSASDVSDGADSMSGTFVIGADGKAIVTVYLRADRVTEGEETLTLSVADQSQSVTVN